MTGTRSGVVPFERSAAYWAVRARKHYRPDHLPEAARLMRKALEKSGDAGLALELSQIYVGMGCLTAAERCLIRVSARQGLTGGICYAIGCSALSRGEEALAEQALETALRLEPDGIFAERAQDLLEDYPWRQEDPAPGTARSDALRDRSRRALAAGRKKEALALAVKAWRKAPTGEAAWWLSTLLPPRQAVPYAVYAARRMRGSVRPRLMAAQTCARAGMETSAQRHLALARALCRDLSDTEAFCLTAWEMGCAKEALTLVSDRLTAYPASVDYLRLKYLSLLHMGEKANARRTLETLLEIDPDDAGGLWYRRHPEDMRLGSERLLLLSALGSLVYAVPERLNRGPLNRLLHRMVMVLAGKMDAEDIYRRVVPLWRHMTPAEKAACDDWREGHYPLAVALYLMWHAGQEEEARQLYAAAPGKKRLARTLRRFARRIQEE